MSLLPLIGVLIVIVGFVLRLHPMAVVMAAALASGLASHLGVGQLLGVLGAAFLKNRYLLLFVLTLPVVGLLEREGLREHAESLMRGLSSSRLRLTAGRLLTAYQLLRQLSAALGLTALGGHAQTVRPLLAPMAAAAAERDRPLDETWRERIFALAAATDNVALFFGEDLFLAFGAVLLSQGVLRQEGLIVEPLRIALWGLPTALAALAIHGWRLHRLDGRLAREP